MPYPKELTIIKHPNLSMRTFAPTCQTGFEGSYSISVRGVDDSGKLITSFNGEGSLSKEAGVYVREILTKPYTKELYILRGEIRLEVFEGWTKHWDMIQKEISEILIFHLFNGDAKTFFEDQSKNYGESNREEWVFEE